MKKLYFGEATLCVTEANGFWFSGGGVKGSFGYYPHLKDLNEKPVYPDTQVRGDLKAATAWNERRIAANGDPLFPSKRDEGSALFLTDLVLSEGSRAKWTADRFIPKSRIAIDDATSTVDDDMLVMKERAWFNNDALESRLYLEYSHDPKEIEKHITRLSDAICLVGGFGAERSRMLYAGKVGLTWKKCEFEIPDSLSSKPFVGIISLRSLVNFRNRPLSGEKTLLLGCLPYITVDQIRGWFVRAYKLCFDEWPTFAQMKGLQFSDCYPAMQDGENIVLAYLPCVNTTKKDGVVTDRTGHPPDDDDQTEQFASGKPSSLREGSFVTNEPNPRVVEVPIERRMRNAMNENFKTKDAGLFVQESIPRGALFAGRISCKGAEEFNGRARFILENLRPSISRCLFDATLHASVQTNGALKNNSPALVVHALPYNNAVSEKGSSNQLAVATTKRYMTQQRRPRRNRITIAPGSVINNETIKQQMPSYMISWKGFGATFDSKKDYDQDKKGPQFIPVVPWKDDPITRSQAGILRRFLHPKATPELLKTWVDNVIAKTKGGKFGIDEPTLTSIQTLLKDKGLPVAQSYIRDYLDKHAQKRWIENKRKLEQNVDKEKKGGVE